MLSQRLILKIRVITRKAKQELGLRQQLLIMMVLRMESLLTTITPAVSVAILTVSILIFILILISMKTITQMKPSLDSNASESCGGRPPAKKTKVHPYHDSHGRSNMLPSALSSASASASGATAAAAAAAALTDMKYDTPDTEDGMARAVQLSMEEQLEQ
jgi:hypothetical protein